MNNVIDEHVLAQRLLKSLVKREFGEELTETNLDAGIGQLTKIVGRMHGNNEEAIRGTFHDMVKLNKLYDGLEEFEKENVIFWMLCLTFGDGYDLEYYSDGVLINTRE
jgi:hypothetical protein